MAQSGIKQSLAASNGHLMAVKGYHLDGFKGKEKLAMKTNPSQEQETVYLPRSEKHHHIVVTEEMHYALRQYAAKHGMSRWPQPAPDSSGKGFFMSFPGWKLTKREPASGR